jgi:O-antigen ligase
VSKTGGVALSILGGAVALGVGLFSTIDPGISVLLTAVLVGAIGAALMPLPGLVATLGALLPIWSIGTLSPFVFDGARLGLALAVFLKARSVGGQIWPSSTRRIALILGATGLVLVVAGAFRPDPIGLTMGYTMVLAVVTAWMALSRVNQPWQLLAGYLFGVTTSAIVLILAGLGFTALTPLADAGIHRLSGLSSSAPLVGYELAIGILIGVVGYSNRRFRLILASSVLICLAALLMSGGRGGVAALGIAILVAVRWRWVKFMPALFVSLVGWGIVSMILDSGQTINMIARILGTGEIRPDATSGRVDLFNASLSAIAQDPIFGTGVVQFIGQQGNGLTPHFALFTFYVAGGVCAAFLVLSMLLFITQRLFLKSPRRFESAGRVSYLVLAALLTMAFTEPNGPFVGTQATTLLLLVIGMSSRRGADVDQPQDRRVIAAI